jgi:iron-regulated transporter 1
MTAYLVWLGVSYNTIGTLRGISSVIGLLGTMAFAISVRTSGLAFTGLWSIIFQFGWLGLCYLSIYIKTLYLALWLLVIGVCCSRIGLWAFDLTITQYMQQEIPENIRGVIGGVQKSLNGFFDLTTFALGLIFSDPKDFHILVSFGYCSVGCAMVLYFFGVYRKRDELH